jgi:hypothetical protein
MIKRMIKQAGQHDRPSRIQHKDLKLALDHQGRPGEL